MAIVICVLIVCLALPWTLYVYEILRLSRYCYSPILQMKKLKLREIK